MLELNLQRKNKINLSDYNSRQDIENRILLSDFSTVDLKVLEEILYSTLKISLKKMTRSLQIPEKDLLAILQKLERGHLLTIQDDSILVDKEIRKSFEFHIQRFDENFKPDMEFLQGLLRKVPIHLLPIWYAIPRSSNNIFESIVEKYLVTPQTFQRYLNDLSFHECVTQNVCDAVRGILNDLLQSPDFTLNSTDVIAKYNLNRANFEEAILLLEFHFIGTVSYIKEEDHWDEIITPFYEWHQYLRFVQTTKTPQLPSASVSRFHTSDFAFVEEMAQALVAIKKGVLPGESSSPLFNQLCQLQFVKREGLKLESLEPANSWLALSVENKAIYLYHHLANPSQHLREAEKSMQRIIHGRWVLFDDFIQGAMVPLNIDSVATLKKANGQWKYNLPICSDVEKSWMYAVIFETFFQSGFVSLGTHQGKDCFALTSFGRSFFEG